MLVKLEKVDTPDQATSAENGMSKSACAANTGLEDWRHPMEPTHLRMLLRCCTQARSSHKGNVTERTTNCQCNLALHLARLHVRAQFIQLLTAGTRTSSAAHGVLLDSGVIPLRKLVGHGRTTCWNALTQAYKLPVRSELRKGLITRAVLQHSVDDGIQRAIRNQLCPVLSAVVNEHVHSAQGIHKRFAARRGSGYDLACSQDLGQLNSNMAGATCRPEDEDRATLPWGTCLLQGVEDRLGHQRHGPCLCHAERGRLQSNSILSHCDVLCPGVPCNATKRTPIKHSASCVEAPHFVTNLEIARTKPRGNHSAGHIKPQLFWEAELCLPEEIEG